MSKKKVIGQSFRKASFSGDAGACVEVARGGDESIMVRDSKNPAGPVLRFTTAEWDAFIKGVKALEFELL